MIKHVAKEQLRVPAKVEYLKELRDFVTKVGKKHGFSDRVINAFKLSIDEAATNIIKHAYRDWDGDITLKIIVKTKSMTIVLIDQGKYFDPRQVNDPDLQRYVAIGKKGGLGIFMMRRLLDSIDYRKTELGNELWLTKNKDDQGAQKFSLRSFHFSLKMRYWLTAASIFSVLLVLAFAILFFQRKVKIEKDFISRTQKAGEVMATDISMGWKQLPLNTLYNLKDSKTDENEFDVLAVARAAINSRLNVDENQLFLNAYIVLPNNQILDCKEIIQEKDGFYDQKFLIPDNAQEKAEHVHVFSQDSIKILNVRHPILDDELNTLGFTHYQTNYSNLEAELKTGLYKLGRLGLLIWFIGCVSLLVLIYLVMNPFKRLQEWVKTLGQTGDIEEVDIDETTEVGEIAQAFSDITKQLRESQNNLAEQERLKKEMQLAQQIQHTLIPQKFPDIEGYDIQSYYESAVEVGGDFYDFVEVDDDTLGVAVADVSGKGVPGSLMMATIRTALRTEARGMKDAAEVLTKVNNLVVNDMRKGMFVTIFYVIIDSRRRKLNFASAGHNPMILYRASTNQTYYLNPKGFPIGIQLPEEDLFKRTIQSDTITLTKDDILILSTDGITEAMNRKRELFGDERFLDVVRNNGVKSATDFIETLKNTLNTFTEGNQQSDDITLVAIKEKKLAQEIELDRAKKAFMFLQEKHSLKEACEMAGITTYAYNSKYRKKFEKEGVDSVEIELTEEHEVRHLSIEEKSKIYDVILKHPEYGAKKIAEVLDSEEYGFTLIKVSKIYNELKERRLNTKELREQFINRGGKLRKRIKPPGNPILTMDGQVIHQKPTFRDEEKRKEKQAEQVEEEVKKTSEPEISEKHDVPATDVYSLPKDKALTEPIEDVLDSRKAIEEQKEREKLSPQAKNYLDKYKKNQETAPSDTAEPEMKKQDDKQNFTPENVEKDEGITRDASEEKAVPELDDNFFQSHVTEFVDSAATDNQASDQETDTFESDQSEFLDQDDIIDAFNKEEQDILDDTKDFEFADDSQFTENESATTPDLDEFDELFEEFADGNGEHSIQNTETDELQENPEFNPDQTEFDTSSLQDKQTLNVDSPEMPVDYPPLIGEFAEPEEEKETAEEKDIQIESEILGGFVEGDFSSVESKAEEAVEKDKVENDESQDSEWFTLEDKDVNLDELEIMSSAYNQEYQDFDQQDYQSQLDEFDKSIDDEEEPLDLDEWYRNGKQDEKKDQPESDSFESEKAWLDFQSDQDEIQSVPDEILENDFDDSQIKRIDNLQIDEDYDFSDSLEWSEDADKSESFSPGNGKSRMDNKDDSQDLTSLLNDNPEYDHPFEEFLEIDQEDGLINEFGETDFGELVEQDEFFGDINQTDSEELLGEDFLNDKELDRDFQEFSHKEEYDFLELLNEQENQEFKGADAPTVEENKSDSDDITSGLDLGSFMEKAVEYYKKSDYEKAIKLFKAIVNITPEDYRIHNLLGDAYFRNKDYTKAAQEYDMVMKLDPQNIKACENLGVVYANQRNLDKAVEQWELLLSLAPHRKDIAKSIEWARHLIIDKV